MHLITLIKKKDIFKINNKFYKNFLMFKNNLKKVLIILIHHYYKNMKIWYING